MNDLIAELVSILDAASMGMGDYAYMKSMDVLKRMYNTPPPSNIRYVAYGPSAVRLAEEHERLQTNHSRMKRNHAKRRKEWKELEENLRNQVNELLVEVEYLENIRTKPKEDLTILEFSA